MGSLLLQNQCIPRVYFQPHMPKYLLAFQSILEIAAYSETSIIRHFLGKEKCVRLVRMTDY